MKKSFRKTVKKLIPKFVFSLREKYEYRQWIKNGRPSPPPHIVKQNAIREYREKYGCNVLVETGTFLGDMIEAQKRFFKSLHSVELSPELFELAKKRFLKDSNVFLWQGDSGEVLRDIVVKLDEPALFWLDGHYSGDFTALGKKECPVLEELEAIFSGRNFDHIILIDDARLFTGEGDYPKIEELNALVSAKNNRYKLLVKDDIIRFSF